LLTSSNTFERDRLVILERMSKLVKSETISIEEKSEILQLMNSKVLRHVITEMFNDISNPRML